MFLNIHLPRKKITRLFIALGILMCGVIASFFLLGQKQEGTLKPSRTTDLISDAGWARYIGATITAKGLHIEPLNRSITHQDGSPAQPNPPINLFGPHLAVTGDFLMTATLTDIDEWGSLRLYGAVPITYDQWRHEGESIDVMVDSGAVTVRIWDGTSSQANDMRIFPFAFQGEMQISLEHNAGTFVISANGRMLGTMPDHSIFQKGEMWIGTDTPLESTGWTLTALRVIARGTGTVKKLPSPTFLESHDDEDALRNLAQGHPRRVHIGSAVSFEPLLFDADYRKIAIGEFNMWTPENGLKPQFIHPEPEMYVWKDVDTFVDIAGENDVLIHGHSLVYHKSNPTWMNEASKGERKDIMVEHIKNIVAHFKGRVAQWDVVNEPLSSTKESYADERQGLESTIWYEAMGEQYIDLAFHTAHNADPSALLYLNDFGLERDGERWDALLGLVKRLKQRGVPIDGVGFESHIYSDGDYSNQAVLKKHMDELARLGLKVRISEIDVSGDDPKQQIAQYVLALDVCLRSLNCTGYSTWGVSDRYGSTTRSDLYPLEFGTSLIWDAELKPKPVYAALQKRLRALP